MCGRTQVLDVHFTTIVDHVRQLGKVQKLSQCDDLTQSDLPRRAEVALELRSYRRMNNWIESIFTVDEEWCLCVNIKRTPPWADQDEQHEPQSTAGFHPLEVMISVWCDSEGIIHCEALSAAG
ncbi:hypothetical protein Y032_0010g1215 [Ancylostoma ceylanicum]|uniref:Uncharacterized protein n=1 Tax=Ancylostoma ceylanicum TaxID=53326 RepID=A0A016VG36_9BILA|nr:hypothetical protein Y032_0010g1215 [Ancylostoma ceylanicum]